MRHGSLFNGLGGFQLAAEWLGWDNIFHCEIDDWLNELIKTRFPNSIKHGDITNTDFAIYRGRIDVISGGDPCQPHSKAGKQKGIADARFLWPQMLRAIKEVWPGWVVNENVRGSLSNGVLDSKVSDLEGAGYSCWPPLLIPSGATKAIHERYRVWLVAYSNENANGYHSGEIQREARKEQDHEQGEDGKWLRPIPGSILSEQNWEEVASRLCGSVDGLPDKMDRNEAIGNAIDPHIAYEIFKAIQMSSEQNDERSVANPMPNEPSDG